MNRIFISFGILFFALFFTACGKTAAPSIAIENARMRLPAPGQTTAAGFFDIVNKGSADILLSASSPVSNHIELHTHIHEDGIMKMRKVDTVNVGAKQTTEFKPRSLHIMIFNVEVPEGAKTVPLTLTFEKSGDIDVVMQVGLKAMHQH